MITILNRRAQSDATRSPGYMYGLTRRDLMAASALGLLAGAPRLAHAAAPAGQLTWALHVSVPPTWFDPAETQALISPYMILYALHDAMVKPMPGTLAGAEPGRILADVGGRHDLRFHDPQRREIPQRRAGHRRGRQVLVRALSRRQP